MNRLMGLLVGVFVFYVGRLEAFYIDKVDKTPCRKDIKLPTDSEINKCFSLAKPSFKNEEVVTDPLALQHAVRDAQAFFKRYWKTHQPVIAPQPFSTNVLSAKKVINTLAFIDRIIEEDKASGIFRIHDTDFLEQNFGFISWKPDHEQVVHDGRRRVSQSRIRLTSYVVYKGVGSYKKTTEFPCALYQLLKEKQKITLTKQEIFAGALNTAEYAKRARPLVWVSRETLEKAMMQGTVLLTMPDNKVRAFNVNISNGLAFDHGLRNLAKQKIYWFFLERNPEAVRRLEERCVYRKNVIFAGDLFSLGLGKIVALQYRNRKTKKLELRLGLIGDRGSAFERNLHHLDIFGGTIAAENRAELQAHLANFPPLVRSFIVYAKKSATPVKKEASE
jgi:hypothetical protein